MRNKILVKFEVDYHQLLLVKLKSQCFRDNFD